MTIMPMIFKLFYIFLPLFFFAFWNASAKEERCVTVFATSDIHGNIASDTAGIFRLATVLKKETAAAGGREKSITIDCGDFSQGSVEASLTSGKIIFDLLNCLHYDVVVPGNHDFDYGLSKLLANRKEMSFEMLCGNFSLSGAKNPFCSWKIFNRNELKIAIIGLTHPGIEGVDNNKVSYKTGSINSTLKEILPEVVLEKPDLIVLAIHAGLYNSGWSLKSIIRKFPEIDIVFAGHTHEAIPGKLLHTRTYFVQTGSNAEYLGEAVVKICEGKKEIISKLIPTSAADPDRELTEKFKSSLNSLELEASKTIAYSAKKVDLNLLTMNSMMEKTKADVVILGLNKFPKIVEGAINYKDVFNAIPHEDSIATMLISKNELKTILHELYSYMKKKKKKYKQVLFAGFSITQARGGITNLQFDKKNLNEEKMLLAFPSYYVEYPGKKFPETRKIAKNSKSKYSNTGILVRDALIAHLTDSQQISIVE